MWTHELFEEDLEKKNYMELADWLTSCRNVVLPKYYDTHEQYLYAVDAFCREWEEFYRQNEEFFKSKRERFKKAAIFTLYKKNISCEVDYGTREKIPSDTFQKLSAVSFKEHLIEEIDQDYSAVYELVKEVFDREEGYKLRLHDVILDQVLRFTSIRVRAFADGEWVKAATYKEFMEKCEQQKYTMKLVTRHKKNSYYKIFDEYDIPKSVYADFISLSACEQEFGKKFFINLGFSLGLNLSLMEKLLNFNGYSIKNKSRQFDVICEKAFRIGFGREYTIALIEKYNTELAKRFDVYKPMPTIAKSKRQPKI